MSGSTVLSRSRADDLLDALFGVVPENDPLAQQWRDQQLAAMVSWLDLGLDVSPDVRRVGDQN